MSGKTNGGPAFPGEYFSPEVFANLRDTEGMHTATKMASGKSQGMTLRDWFAGQALAGLLADREATILTTEERAYLVADRMIKERSK